MVFLWGGATIKKVQSGTFDVKSYSVDRFVRIMLPLFSALLLFVIANLLMHNPIDWKACIGNLLSLQGVTTYSVIEPLWSLAYEVWFYILAGAVSVFFMKTLKPQSLFLSAVCLLVSLMVFTKLSTHYLFIWLLGALAYITIPNKKNKLILLCSSVVLLLLIVVLQLSSGSNLADMSFGLSRKNLELLFGFFFALFLQQIVLFEPKKEFSMKLNNFGKKAATFSYTLYLTHIVVLRVLEYCNFPKSPSINMISISLYLAELLIAIIVAYVLYWCFEKRTYVVKQWIKGKLNI